MNFLTIFALVLATAFQMSSGAKQIPTAQPLGKKAAVGQFPYQVGIVLKDENSATDWCGGSLFGNEWILTAAHCFDGIVEATVYLGAIDLDSAEVTHKLSKGNFVVHPDWDADSIKNDIALVRIPFTAFSETIQPVKLPSIGTSYRDYVGDSVISSGWGLITDTSSSLADLLQWDVMDIFPNKVCTGYYGAVISPSNVCIGTYGGVSSCKGDTGGPLVLEETKTQIGITSFGARNGCKKGFPAVLTRVSNYLEWIQETTGISY